ncbi:hypothetical protein [Rhodococcus sp. OK519]|uniref:hypothetical protein n=1 Tax=Rhodococcus sp. OK519 TaxID=2135729 RepID=UPI0011B2337A
MASTDRNFHGRNYFNAHDRTGDVYLISGFGVYPNLSAARTLSWTPKRGRPPRSLGFVGWMDRAP